MMFISDLGSWIWIFLHPGSRIQLSKIARDPLSRSATLEEYFREKDTSAAAHLHKIPDQIKILSLSSRVVNGPYSGKRAFFQTSSAYVWGHHLARANLMYNIRAGDMFRVEVICAVYQSVGDPDPDPQDSHVFEPPGSGSICQWIGLRILPFSYKGVMRTEIMLAK